ncbi:hypothetical protein [Flexithrix dorotheae]|uniref:hypothetical protein n=1 Tax=Flexithrix dorotheae TaxID=70993 RepID=UPI0003793339|nr:hypothetical protein [Flexithrix dorotheae]
MRELYNIRFYLLLLITLNVFQAKAQETLLEDPLNKPNLWKKVVERYDDKKVWEEYYNKKWNDLSGLEEEQIIKLQNQIAIEQIAQEEAIFDMGLEEAEEQVVVEENFDDEFWGGNSQQQSYVQEQKEEEERLRVEQVTYLQQLEQMMTAEPLEITEMKGNINANFDIIEDMFFEEYVAHGAEYTFYNTVYPRGNYSMEQWIEEKSKELRYLKKKEFEKLKGQLMASY